MDPIKGEKLRPMKSNKMQNKSQIFYSLIVHLLIAIACSLLCSYSYWFPSLYTVKRLLFMSLPNSWYGVFNPRCLFVVANFIIVFLIGESRLSGRQSSPANELYDEYVERTRSLREPPSTFQEKTVQVIWSQKEDNVKILEEKEVGETKEDSHEDDKDEDFKECEGTDEEENEKKEDEKEDEKKEEEKEEEQQEEAAGIPAEVLNKRVEEFIARVNKQRWLEARFLVCSKA